MSVSTCVNCATRLQLEEIKTMVHRVAGCLLHDEHLDKAYRLLDEAKELLGTVIDIKRDL